MIFFSTLKPLKKSFPPLQLLAQAAFLRGGGESQALVPPTHRYHTPVHKHWETMTQPRRTICLLSVAQSNVFVLFL